MLARAAPSLYVQMAAVNLGITLNAKYESNAKTAEHKQGQVFAAPDLGKGREPGALAASA